MTKREKLLERLTTEPKDFSWTELVVVLKGLGFREVQGAGSRVRFEHPERPGLHLHKPHPAKVLKPYQVRQVLEFLENEGLL